MESITELRNKLQREKVENRERPWGYRWFQRGPSIYITRIIIRTPVTPDMLSVFSILAGVYGAFLLFSPLWHIKFIALFFFYLHLLLDRVDGEVARYKKLFSLKGIYLDELNHLAIPLFFFLALAWNLKDSTAFAELAILGAGITAAFASVMLRITHNLSYGIFLKKYIKHKGNFSLPPSAPSIQDLRTKNAVLYSFLRILHQPQDFFLTLVVFGAAILSERFFASDGFLFPYTSIVLFVYAILLPLIAVENSIKGVLTIERHMQELDSTLQATGEIDREPETHQTAPPTISQ